MDEENEGLDLSDAFGTNPLAEVQGVWKELGGGAAIKVARLGNKEATRAYRKLPKVHRSNFEEGVLDNAQTEAFIADFVAKHILRDWRGLADQGKPLPAYDPGAGKKFLIKYRRFREKVWEIATDDSMFNIEVEEDAKNLPELSTGSSGTTPMPSKPSVVVS